MILTKNAQKTACERLFALGLNLYM